MPQLKTAAVLPPAPPSVPADDVWAWLRPAPVATPLAADELHPANVEGAVVSVPRSSGYEAAKRGLDIAIATLALVLATPVLLFAAAAIKMTSGGPVLFRQKRAGRERSPFTMYKLRTMYVGADDDKELFRPLNDLAAGPCFKIRRDPRVTGIGRWLRKYSVDELPQLWNVLRGDMSLVGPRPLPLDEVRGDGWQQALRHSVRPGLTCLWQVSGRTEIPWEEWLALDLWYVRRRRIGLDLAILARTVPAVVTGRGAY